MPSNTTVSLEPHHEAFIRAQIESGEYASVSEVVRAALQLMEQQKRQEADLHKALRVGMQSERAVPWVFERLRARHGVRRDEDA